jgi:hypothetical protein
MFAHNDRWVGAGLIALLLLAIIYMASFPSAKKPKSEDGGKQKRFLGWFKRSKTGNDQLNSPRAAISSASGDHDPGPGNDAGNAEPPALGEYSSAVLSVIYDDLTFLQSEVAPCIRVCPVLDSCP